MIRSAVVLLLVAVHAHAAGMTLAGERIRFDGALHPQFTENQIRNSSDAVRGGLALWAMTEHGRRLIQRFSRSDFEIVVTEDVAEEGPGRAPQPGIAALAAANDRSQRKSYALILNPNYVRLPRGAIPFLWRQPSTPDEVMAAAWAAEMLHIYFYSKGISLPHHSRSDFQKEWRSIARELGFPDMRHEDEEIAHEGWGIGQ